MTTETEKEIKKWNDFVHMNIINIFKEDHTIAPHALIFTNNKELQKQALKGNAESARDRGEISDEQQEIIDKSENPYGFMHMALDRFMENDAGKDMAAIAIQRVIKETKAIAYAFVSEAWIAKLGPIPKEEFDKNRDKYTRPSELPDNERSEIIMCHVESENHIDFRTYEIVRERYKGEEIPWLYLRKEMSYSCDKDTDSSKHSEGRFCGFLHKNATTTTDFDGGVARAVSPKKEFSISWNKNTGFESEGDEDVSDEFERKFKSGAMHIIQDEMGDVDLSEMSEEERDNHIAKHTDSIIEKMKNLFYKLKTDEENGSK